MEEKEIFHQFAETQWPWSIEQVMRSEMKRLLTPINNINWTISIETQQL